MDALSIMLTSFFASGILYACFCRLTRMDAQVHRSVRWAYSALGTAAAGLMLAPLVPDWNFTSHPLIVLLTGAHLATLIATRKVWNDTSTFKPAQTQRPHGQ